jgi:hypothetical protein
MFRSDLRSCAIPSTSTGVATQTCVPTSFVDGLQSVCVDDGIRVFFCCWANKVIESKIIAEVAFQSCFNVS